MLGIAAAATVVLAAVGFLGWRAMTAPLYTPGMVRSGQSLRAPLEPPRQAADAGYWQVEEDIRLAHDTQGSGRPVLVVHGGPGYPIRGPLAGLEPLAADLKFYFYDQRGCGKSTRPFDRFGSKNYFANMKELDRTLGIGAQVADIERIRRILGRDRLVLMGHSFGGFLAAMYAAEFPEHVDALVLVAPAGVLVLPDKAGGFFDEIRRRLPAGQRAECDRFLKDYLDFGSIFTRSEEELAGMNRRIGQYFLVAAGRAGEVQDDPPADNGGWMVQAMYISMGRRHDYRPALRRVRAPALVIHGEGDVIAERISRMYADCLPAGRLYVMKGGQTRGGHAPFRDDPETFAAAVREFLAEKR